MRFRDLLEGEVIPFPKPKRPHYAVGDRVRYSAAFLARHKTMPDRAGTVTKVLVRNGKVSVFMAWDDGGRSGTDISNLRPADEPLTEAKWWEDKPTITLYHGTSSALIPALKKDGLLPPKDVATYAFDILEEYVPRSEWTEELIQFVNEHAVRYRGGRSGDRGSVIYCSPEPKSPSGYARSYADHGGEIAYDVWQAACLHVAPELSLRDMKTNPPLPPRWKGAKPIIVQIEVPKEWCIFNQDADALRDRLTQIYHDKTYKYASQYDSLAAFLDDALDDTEVRVKQAVPPSMIIGFLDALPDPKRD